MARNDIVTGFGMTGGVISSSIRAYQPAKSNFFTLQVQDIDELLPSNFDYSTEPTVNDYIEPTPGAAQEDLLLTVKKTNVPKCTINEIEIRRGNEVAKYAGTPTWDDLNIDVQDMIGLNVKKILYALRSLAYSSTTKTGGRANDYTQDGINYKGYKRTYILTEYTPDKDVVTTYKIYNGWVKEVSEPDYDVENDEPRVISIVLAYDYAEII